MSTSLTGVDGGSTFAAVDIGASSGRIILGRVTAHFRRPIMQIP
jgi:hypothetical protein